MPKYYIMPTKCCCCSLRTASIVVGTLSVVIALTFMGLLSGFSSGLRSPSCTRTCVNDKCTSNCIPPDGAQKMVSSLLAILAITNAVEVMMSVGLIWGASQRILFWVTGWLLVTASWILLHWTVALSLLFATSEVLVIILVSMLGLFMLGMALLAFLTVLSLRKEIINAPTQSQL